MVNPAAAVVSTPADVNTVVSSTSSIPMSAIIGIVVGVAIVAMAIIIGGVTLYRRTISNQKTIWARQLAMIDLKSINLGEAKSSIVSRRVEHLRFLTCDRYRLVR